jgi:hypothetical protein
MLRNVLDIAIDARRDPRKKGSEYAIRCPYPDNHRHGDADPSCSINPEKNVWCCHACGASGGAADLANVLGVDAYGSDEGTGVPVAPLLIVTAEHRERAGALAARAGKEIVESAEAQAYLDSRRLTVVEAMAAGVGFIDRAEGATGVFDGKCMAFIYRDDVGPRYVKLRPLDTKKFVRLPTGVPSCLFNLAAVRPDKSMTVTEGEFDVVALGCVGRSSAVSVPDGRGTKVTASLLAPLATAPVVFIATDQDDPGEALAHKLARVLGYDRCRRVLCGGHKDANDALIAGAVRADFDRWFEEAKPMHEPPWPAPEPLTSACDVPFPVEVLPPVLRDFVRAVSLSTQTPLDLPALTVLGIVAAACAKKFEVQVRGDYSEPLNLYLVLFLASGERKSPVVRQVVRPIDDFALKAVQEYRRRASDVTARRNMLTARLKDAEKRALRATDDAREQAEQEVIACQRQLDEMPVAVAPEFRISDVTPERLARALQEQGGRIAVIDAENAFFNNIAGRYAADHRPNLDTVLKAHAGDPVLVHRQNREPVVVQRPALTIAVSVQPAVLRKMGATEDFRDLGLLARILPSVPRGMVGRRDVDPPEPDPAVLTAYHSVITALMELPLENERDTNVPRQLRLSQETSRFRLDLAQTIEDRLKVGGDLAGIADWGSKFVGAVLRIAGLLHVVQHAGKGDFASHPIDPETFSAARAIGEYFIEHAKVAFQQMAVDASTDTAVYVLGHIKRLAWTTFSVRDLHQVVKSKLVKVADLEPVLRLLERHGYIRPVDEEARSGGPGRPPSRRFEVNPRWLRPDNGEAEVAAVSEGPVEFDIDDLVVADVVEEP